jgi:hypothetical protein
MRANLRETVPAFVLLLAVACGGGKKDTDKPSMGNESGEGDQAASDADKLPSIPASPAPIPDMVLATISIGDPQGQFAGLAAFADAVQPGFGAMMSPAQVLQGVAGSVGAPGIDGVDLAKPIHLVLLDPQKGGGQSLLVVGVADQNKMIGSVGGGAALQVHDGFAAVGSGAALQAASPYALSNLAKSAPPKNPHGVIYMNRIMAAYGPQLDAAMRQSMGQNPDATEKKMAEHVVKVLGSVERIEADIEASGQLANATFSVFPAQGSPLATWTGLQKPSDYSVAARLPAGAWLMVAAGRLDWGPMQGFLAEIASAQGKPDMAAWMGVFGQEVAVALLAKEDKTVRVAGVVSVADSKKLGPLTLEYVKKMATEKPAVDKMEVSAKANAYKTGGASLHAITLKPGASTSDEEKKQFEKVFGKAGMKSYFGVAGDWMVFSLDKDKGAKQMAAKLVANTKAKTPKSALGATFDKALADSKARNESGVMVFDLSALAPEPSKAQGAEVTVGLGFDGAVMRSRITVPPTTLRFFMQQRMGGGQPPPPSPN